MRETITPKIDLQQDAIQQKQRFNEDTIKKFGFVTTTTECCNNEKINLKIKYPKNNFFSTPETNMLAQISQLSCGKTILDFI